MDRKLLDYLPPVLRDVMEMQAINNANEPEISIAWGVLERIMANQFLDEADAWGVSTWEQELRLRPKDTDTLAERKARIKAVWNARLPYSLPWLRRWLDGICGAEGHRETVTDYTLRLEFDHAALQTASSTTADILEQLLPRLPANLLLEYSETTQENAPVPLRLGGIMTSVVSLPLPEQGDRFDFWDSCRVGGKLTTYSVMPIGEMKERLP